MTREQRLVEELCQIVASFLCPEGQPPDLERALAGPHLFAKGGTQPVCTVRLVHGATYHLEFVYRFWAHRLSALHFPFSPCFVISNNGLAATLKCFVCEPRDAHARFAHTRVIDSDVPLERNASLILGQDDFVKFKTNLVFSRDLDIFNSMVVCRTYLTEHRQALQFLVVKPRNQRRVASILSCLTAVLPTFAAKTRPVRSSAVYDHGEEQPVRLTPPAPARWQSPWGFRAISAALAAAVLIAGLVIPLTFRPR